MVNNTEFAKRLKIMMEHYQLSASAFADKVHVQRSSISHLLSGRNKPSLDFVLKVIKEFEDVELYWLLNGKGNFPNTTPTLSSDASSSKSTMQTTNNNLPLSSEKGKVANPQSTEPDKTIERIVLFYTDGTFKEYLK